MAHWRHVENKMPATKPNHQGQANPAPMLWKSADFSVAVFDRSATKTSFLRAQAPNSEWLVQTPSNPITSRLPNS